MRRRQGGCLRDSVNFEVDLINASHAPPLYVRAHFLAERRGLDPGTSELVGAVDEGGSHDFNKIADYKTQSAPLNIPVNPLEVPVQRQHALNGNMFFLDFSHW